MSVVRSKEVIIDMFPERISVQITLVTTYSQTTSSLQDLPEVLVLVQEAWYWEVASMSRMVDDGSKDRYASPAPASVPRS